MKERPKEVGVAKVKKPRQSHRKRFASVLSIVLAIALVATGTYAWQNFGDTASGNNQGQPGPAGGRLHDDYQVVGQDNGLLIWESGLNANKDVYVENYEEDGLDPVTGEEDPLLTRGRDIFTRVKLYEYMEIGQGATEDPGYDSLGVPQNVNYISRTALPIAQGADRDDVTTWTARLPQRDMDSDMFKNRWEWVMGGFKTYMPTFNKDNHSQETDIKGDAYDPRPLQPGELMNATRQGGSQAYDYPLAPGTDPDAGLHDYFVTEDYWEAPEKYYDSSTDTHMLTPGIVGHHAKLTATAQIMTMEQWMDAGSEPMNAWVLDVDGWCYWANPIAPQSATGLLMDSITLLNEPDNEWWYAIYVKSEMVTAGDWTRDSTGGGFYADPREEPTSNAEDLMYIVTGRIPAVTDIYLSPAMSIIQINETLTIDAEVITVYTTNPAYEELTWTVVPSSARFNGGTFTPSAADAGRVFTITATSVKTPSVQASVKVYVVPAGQTVVTGEDGNLWQDNGNNTFQRIDDNGNVSPNIVCPVEVGKPGRTSDRAVEVIGGVPYYPVGDGKHYWGDPKLRIPSELGDDGEPTDGLLGTSDDEMYFKDPLGVMQHVEDFVRMSVSPSPGTVERGKTLTITSTIRWEGAEITDYNRVTYTIVGTHVAATTVGATGKTVTLTVPYHETATTLTIRVDYPGTPNGSGGYLPNGVTKDITISVTGLTIPMGATTFNDTNGVAWRIIKDNRNASGQGSIMIWTANAYNNGTSLSFVPSESLYYDTANFPAKPYFTTNGTLRIQMNLWYKNQTSSSLKALARVPNLGVLDGVLESGTNLYNPLALSTPGALAGSATDNIVFPLSASEITTYLSNTADMIAANGGTQGYYIYTRSQASYTNNAAYGGVSMLGHYPSNGSFSSSVGSDNRTVRDGTNPASAFCFRPAMWIQV